MGYGHNRGNAFNGPAFKLRASHPTGRKTIGPTVADVGLRTLKYPTVEEMEAALARRIPSVLRAAPKRAGSVLASVTAAARWSFRSLPIACQTTYKDGTRTAAAGTSWTSAPREMLTNAGNRIGDADSTHGPLSSGCATPSAATVLTKCRTDRTGIPAPEGRHAATLPASGPNPSPLVTLPGTPQLPTLATSRLGGMMSAHYGKAYLRSLLEVRPLTGGTDRQHMLDMGSRKLPDGNAVELFDLPPKVRSAAVAAVEAIIVSHSPA